MARIKNDKLFPKSVAATVASGQTTSAAIDLEDRTIAGFVFPSTFDGSTIGLQMSETIGGTYYTVTDGEGADLSIPCTASKYVPITNYPLVAGIRFCKIVCGTSQSTTSTEIKIITRPVS